MVCVDNTVTDLVAGYDRIVAGEKKVAERAAFRRKAAQQQQEQRAQAARAAWEARRRRLTPLIVLSAAAVVGLAALVALAGLFLVPLWLVPPDSPRLAEIYGLIVVALLIISVVVVALAAGAWLWLVGRRPPVSLAPPSPPPQPLLPRWRAAMSDTLPPPETVVRDDDPWTWGYPGEYELVTRLAALPTIDAFPPYILYSLRPGRGDDLDAVVVGQRGICLFEVKYWSGRVTWRGGRWEHMDIDKYTGVETPNVHKQWPDEQWLRMADEIRFTLNRRAPSLMARYSRLGEVQGGIVFAHPGATLQIGSGIAVFTGRIDDWLVFYQQVRGLVSLDERTALEVVEALLARHNQVVGQAAGATPRRRSMLAEADRLITSA